MSVQSIQLIATDKQSNTTTTLRTFTNNLIIDDLEVISKHIANDNNFIKKYINGAYVTRCKFDTTCLLISEVLFHYVNQPYKDQIEYGLKLIKSDEINPIYCKLNLNGINSERIYKDVELIHQRFALTKDKQDSVGYQLYLQVGGTYIDLSKYIGEKDWGKDFDKVRNAFTKLDNEMLLIFYLYLNHSHLLKAVSLNAIKINSSPMFKFGVSKDIVTTLYFNNEVWYNDLTMLVDYFNMVDTWSNNHYFIFQSTNSRLGSIFFKLHIHPEMKLNYYTHTDRSKIELHKLVRDFTRSLDYTTNKYNLNYKEYRDRILTCVGDKSKHNFYKLINEENNNANVLAGIPEVHHLAKGKDCYKLTLEMNDDSKDVVLTHVIIPACPLWDLALYNPTIVHMLISDKKPLSVSTVLDCLPQLVLPGNEYSTVEFEQKVNTLTEVLNALKSTGKDYQCTFTLTPLK